MDDSDGHVHSKPAVDAQRGVHPPGSPLSSVSRPTAVDVRNQGTASYLEDSVGRRFSSYFLAAVFFLAAEYAASIRRRSLPTPKS